MKIFSFVEGANPRKGGLGLVGVPWIAKSVAERGHQVVLNIAGYPNPGTEKWVQPDVRTALECKMGAGKYGIVTYPCIIQRWAFSPAMLRAYLPYIRDVDFIILHSTYSFPVLVGYLLARRFHKPYGLWPHGIFAPIQRQISGRKKKIYNGLIARAIMDNASVLFYSAKGEREEADSLNFKAPSVIVPHGLNFDDFVSLPPRGTFRSRYMAGHSGPLVLFLSRINQKKGLDILARAFALVLERLPNARLAIVGSSDPPQFEDRAMSWIKESGISDFVVMPGLLVGEDKMQAFADADVFVLPSQAENFGFAVFEAMASRIPVVISDTLDYAKEVDSHQAGISVPRNPQAFANAIVRILTDKDLHRELGQNGFSLARTYSWDKTGERVERTIECILRGEPLPPDLIMQEG
ncbi:MAG: glycosyltransferase [Candidatus Brocadiia bacterium]|nr:MAG: glycosyltransferase [Candidatus Brocadiia bacterium]